VAVSALFLMGSVAIFLLGTFNGFIAQTLPVRVAVDTPALALARLYYVFAGVGIFLLGALGFQWRCEDQSSPRCEAFARFGFWLMFVGFNLACFPTTLRRSHGFLSDPLQLFSGSVGPEVAVGAFVFVGGVLLCVGSHAAIARSLRT
jgi:cytochrome c oxidase subunit 1/cytochrome c oxidase subunit I+III